VGLELPPQAEANRISVMADTKVRMASVCHPSPEGGAGRPSEPPGVDTRSRWVDLYGSGGHPGGQLPSGRLSPGSVYAASAGATAIAHPQFSGSDTSNATDPGDMMGEA